MRKVAAAKIMLVAFVFLLTLGVMALLGFISASVDVQGQDVYYSWVEGQRLLSGQNPYARILTGNMAQNQKYATYFPAFYLVSALSEQLGLRDFPSWIAFWRLVFWTCDIGIAVLIFVALDRCQSTVLGILGALFWLFNRWTLYVVWISDVDFLPLFLLVLSLLLLPRRRRSALLLFSLSLAIKQVAIFLVPVYLIWIWQQSDRDRVRQVLLAAVLIASVPFVTSLPFLFWNAEGLIKSVVFSVTRNPDDHFDAGSVGELLGGTGTTARLPMLGLLLLTYVGLFQRRVNRYVSSLIVMAIFFNFNSVLFFQYVPWILPFAPLALCGESAARRLNPVDMTVT